MRRYNVQNFVYVRRRPFHPQRLFEFIYDRFILQQPVEEEEDDDEGESMPDADSDTEEAEEDSDEEMEEVENPLEIPEPEVVIANKKADPLLRRLFRSKGEYWLATRPGRAGEWSQAGAMLTLRGGRRWFCTIDKSEYETGSPEIDAMVTLDIEKGGAWGDRRQELVFIGEGLDVENLEARLDRCLLTDQEWKTWEDIMKASPSDVMGGTGEDLSLEGRLADVFDDGFPEWDDEEEDHTGHSH